MNSEAVNLIFGTESDGSGFLRFGVLPGFNLRFGFYLAKRQVSASRKLAGWCTRRAFRAYVQRLSVFVKQFLQRKNRHFSPYELQYKIKLLRKEFRLAQNVIRGRFSDQFVPMSYNIEGKIEKSG